MAGDEDQPQDVVAERVVVEDGIEVGEAVEDHEPLEFLRLTAELGDPNGEPVVAAQPVDAPVLGRSHQPGPGIGGYARGRPLFERFDERVLRQFLGEPDVADQGGESGEDARGFQAPDRFHRGTRILVRHGQLSGPYTWRRSPSPSLTIAQNRLDSSMASSFDRTSMRAKLTMASFASV